MGSKRDRAPDGPLSPGEWISTDSLGRLRSNGFRDSLDIGLAVVVDLVNSHRWFDAEPRRNFSDASRHLLNQGTSRANRDNASNVLCGVHGDEFT